MKRKYLSLFSGAMGLDIGLEKSGFDPVLFVENDKAAVETIKANRPNVPVFGNSIVELDKATINELAGDLENIDLIAGGPPCQSFSVFGKRLGIKDSRGQLLFEYLRMVDEYRPKVFLLENVRGLLSMSIVPKGADADDDHPEYKEKGSLLNLLFEEFRKIGYTIDCYVVNTVNYGSPQIRERIIIIGNKYGLRSSFPQPSYSNRKEDALPPFRTLGDAIGEKSSFVDSDPDILNFSPRKLKYLSMVPEGGNWRSLPEDVQIESMGKSWYLKGGRSAYWRKLSFSFPSPTVVTMPNHAGTSMCHPTELRAISVGEAAAIQEFPSDWKFVGSVGEKFKQIGNAVPIRLGETAGRVIMKLFEDIRNGANAAPGLKAEIHKIRPHVRTRTFWKNGEAFSGDISYYQD